MSEPKHDSLFKHTFSQLPTAREQLQSQLPAEIAALVRWDTLSLRPGSFIDRELNALHTDLLFEAKLSGKGSVLLYLLFEHQSAPEPIMALRLLRYMLRIWSKWLDENEGSLPLPYLVPLVLYNGERRWDVSMQLSGLFPERHRGLFAPYVPEFTYRLLDLCRTPEEALRGTVLRTLTLVWLKRGHEDGFWQQLPGYLDALRQLRDSTGGLSDIEPLLRYLVSANPREIPDDIKRTLAQFAPQTEGWFMTWAEQLREEGRNEERTRARERERILLSKMRQQALTLLRARFGDLPDALVRKVEAATEEQLDVIGAATSLDELFGQT